jgi:protein required for attachment to host cells
MKKPAIAKGHWVVVCDGRKAVIFENAGDEKYLILLCKEVHEHDDAPTHEQGASPPGRTFQSMGHGRSAIAQTDWHDEGERSFLRKLADRLNSAIEVGETKTITVVAAPRALGMIRPAYSSALRHAIVREVAKDLVKQPASEIEHALTKVDA